MGEPSFFDLDNDKPHHWRRISKEREEPRPVLAGEAEADVVVVGGGFTALSAALALREAGASVALLEAKGIGAGASGRTNGQVIPHHSGQAPSEMVARLGAERGERYNALVASAATRAFDLIRRHEIACDPVQNGWIQAAHSEKTCERVRRIEQEWRALGARVEWLDREEIAVRSGARHYFGGWQAHEGGHVNPYALAQGLARAAQAGGCAIFERSAVEAVRPDGSGWLVATGQGRIRCRRVLVATNGLTGAFWPKLSKAMIPVKVYQAASEPLGGNLRGLVLPDNQAMSDTRRDIGAFRYDCDGSLVTVGSHTLWHDAERRGLAALERKLARYFPQIAGIGTHDYWEGVLAAVPDRFPRIMRLAPGVVFAGIYSGRGVAMSLTLGGIAARVLVDDLAEEDSPIPVTPLATIPAHGIAVKVARYMHPYHRLRDRLG